MDEGRGQEWDSQEPASESCEVTCKRIAGEPRYASATLPVVQGRNRPETDPLPDVPCGGRVNRLAKELEKARAIAAQDGLIRLGVRSVSRALRIARRMAGIGPEALEARQTLAREALLERVDDVVKERQARDGAGAVRRPVEIAHLLRHHCQSCSHFSPAGCERVTTIGQQSARQSFVDMLVAPSGECPETKWPKISAVAVRRLNLVYFIYPARHPDRVWEWNIAELLRRLHHFNGRRIITVASNGPGGGLEVDPPEAVVSAFAGHDVEFRFVINDPKRGEAPHFLPAMREIASTDPSEAIFYAHAKGVSRRQQVDELRAWTAAMYHHNLDRIDEVCSLLRRWPCAGIAKSYGFPEAFLIGRTLKTYSEGGRPWHAWHYAGTFWWARHDALFSRPDWEDFEIYNYATEKYLANFFRSDEALCLAYDDCGDPRQLSAWGPCGDDFDAAAYALQSRIKRAA